MRTDFAGGYSYKETAPNTVTNTVAEMTLFEYVIPAGDFGTRKNARFSVLCSLTTPLIVPPNLTIRVRLASNVLTVLNTVGLATGLSNKPFKIEGEIVNLFEAANTNSQYVYAQINQYANAIPILSNTGASLEGAEWTNDLTTAKTFKITAQFNALSAAAALARKYAMLEIR